MDWKLASEDVCFMVISQLQDCLRGSGGTRSLYSGTLCQSCYPVYWQWRKSVKIIGGDETEPSKVAHIISRKPRKYIRYFSPKTGGLRKKKKKWASSKLSHILRPKSEILTFYCPKTGGLQKKKKKKRSSSILILIIRSLFYTETISRFLQGTKNNFAGYDILLGGMIDKLLGGWSPQCIPPSKIIGGDASPPQKVHPPHPPRDLRPCVLVYCFL